MTTGTGAPAGHEPLLAAHGLSVLFPVGSQAVARLRNEERMLRAVDGVDLEIGRGEALAVVGESGSGKSTLALALCGLRPVDTGEIMLNGKTLPARRSRADQRRIQMVFQDPYSSLNPRLTVGGVLRELLRVHHVVPRKQVDEESRRLLTLVGLGGEALGSYPRQFSGGQRQRIGIARALAVEPDFVVCDEPVSSLDVSIQAQIVNLLEELRERLRLTYLFIAHDLAVVHHLSDRVAVMYLGRIVEIAPKRSLYANPMHPYTKALLSAVPVPDRAVEAGRQRMLLPGEVPSPLRPPTGCRLHPRCPMAREECRTVVPALRPQADGHWVACHLYGERGVAADGATGAKPPSVVPTGAERSEA